MHRLIFVGFLCLGLAGCASVQPQPTLMRLSSTFDAESVAWFNSAGTGIIEGQAFFQTRGGQPRTCAGLEVGLQPRSEYGDERLTVLYGGTSSGHLPAAMTQVQFTPDSLAYQQARKTTTCDAQGNFRLSGLPSGNYFLVTGIVWEVPGRYGLEGGSLMQSVSISEGESKRVILTP